MQQEEKYTRVKICVLIFSVLLCITHNDVMATEYDSIIPALSQAIQGAMQQANITGLSVALVDDQEIVWAEGFGYADKENDVKATPETLYRVASVSKLLTATAIMQLVDQGKIDLDQALQTYLPEFSVKSRFPDTDPISVRHLLTHHSGLPSDWLPGKLTFGENQETLIKDSFATLLEEIKDAYVTDPPNTTFSYSNLGYSVLGHVVEKVSGQEFSAYVDEALLKPMGMSASSFRFTFDMTPLLAKEYQNGAEQEYSWVGGIPGAMLHTTVLDLGQFMSMMFADGKAGSQHILQPQTVAEIWRPQNSDVSLDFDVRWGLSWWLLDLGLGYAGKIAWHSGGVGMWRSLLVTLPEHELGVVILSNSVEAEPIEYQIAPTILEHALEVKAGITRPPAAPPEVVSLSEDELRSHTGLYTTDLGWITIRSEGTDLYADAVGQSFKLLPHGKGRFSIEGVSVSDAELVFKTVNERTVLKLYGHAVGGLGFGERLETTPVSEAWMNRVGSYEITNGKPGFVPFLSDVQLKSEHQFLILEVTIAEGNHRLGFPIGLLSDDEAVILGLGQRNRGDTISIVEVDGEEHLFYSGYLMRKLGPTELLQRALEAAVDSSDTNYPGAVLHVSSPELGTWTGAAGLGEIATDTAMRPDDKFRAGSLTKPFISVIILQLVEEGLLALDDTLPEVLPESVTGKFPNSDQMTVRMLLNHTAGLPDFMDLAGPELVGVALGGSGVEPNPGKVWTEEEFLDFAAALEPLFAPGEAQGYSNTDYLLLGMIIEEATGRTWRKEFRERIIEELDLKNTLLPEIDDRTMPGNHAHGYTDFGSGVMDATELVTASVVGAAGGQSLVTTPEDLTRFMDAALTGELFQQDETLNEMLTWVDWPDGNPLSPYLDSYGLGLAKADFGSGIEGIGHSGDTAGGYHVFVFHLPDQDMTISGAVNFYDYQAGFLLIPRVLEILVPGYTAPKPTPTPTGNVYQDPQGRFSMPLSGDWTPVETDGTYAKYAYADMDLAMSIVTVESDNPEIALDLGLRHVGLDPATLTETNRVPWDKWTVFYYSLGDGQGVTALGQLRDGTGYLIVATGEEALVANPPEDIMKTIQGFSLVGESAGGGLMGPVSDMVRFGQMMLNQGELDGVRILTAESVALLQEVQMSTGGEPLEIGLAWHFGEDAEHPYIEHDGGGAGLQAKLRLYMQDGLAIAVMANGGGFDRNEFADAAVNVVFTMLEEQ